MTQVITEAPETATEPATTTLADPPAAETPRLRQLMGRYSGPRDLEGQLRLAARLASARYAIPRQYRDNEGDVLALIQHAIALDIELMVAADNLHFSPAGVAGMRARLMHALVIRAGHKIEVLHADERKARMRMVRGDGKPGGGAQWTIFEAQQASLVKIDKDNPWRNYPGDMLWARCISRLTRRWAPEVTMGMYEVSELDAIPADEYLDPVDLTTAMRDVDGNLVPAPDVVELLKDLDTATAPEIRDRWKIASQEGMMHAYAGTVEGVHHTVEEVLFDAGTAAQQREEEARKQVSKRIGKPDGLQDGKPDSKPDGQQRDFFPTMVDGEQRQRPDPANNRFYREPDQPEPATVPAEQAPAGQGERLECGCNPAALLASGRHEAGCTR